MFLGWVGHRGPQSWRRFAAVLVQLERPPPTTFCFYANDATVTQGIIMLQANVLDYLEVIRCPALACPLFDLPTGCNQGDAITQSAEPAGHPWWGLRFDLRCITTVRPIYLKITVHYWFRILKRTKFSTFVHYFHKLKMATPCPPELWINYLEKNA